MLNLMSALVDGAGFGSDGRSSPDPTTARFPQGVLASFPWEGWWEEEPGSASDGKPRPATGH